MMFHFVFQKFSFNTLLELEMSCKDGTKKQRAWVSSCFQDAVHCFSYFRDTAQCSGCDQDSAQSSGCDQDAVQGSGCGHDAVQGSGCSRDAAQGSGCDRDTAQGSGCDQDVEEYNMKHPRRGVALIFNHEKFDHMPTRTGSSKDCANLSHELKELGFEVRSHKDLKYHEMVAILNETCEEDHSLADCLMVVVMSHGNSNCLYARDIMYQTEELWMRFMGNNCPSLIGKPKLFFIQACRGMRFDPGVVVDKVDGYAKFHIIPIHADILVAYSTVEGYYSWRNPQKGSWFIQALCQELHTNGRTRDLMTLLTFVCRRVAIDYQSSVPGNENMNCKKQVPAITSMLTRLIYFR